MTPEGRRRLERFVTHFEALATEGNLNQWVHPQLLDSSSQNTMDVWHTFADSQKHFLRKIFYYLRKKVEVALGINCEACPEPDNPSTSSRSRNDHLLDFFSDVIRFFTFPGRWDIILKEEPDTLKTTQQLLSVLRVQLCSELAKALDELFIGCESWRDFLDREDLHNLYIVVDKLILGVNQQYEIRQAAHMAHDSQLVAATTYPTANTFMDMAKHYASIARSYALDAQILETGAAIVADLLQQAAHVSKITAQHVNGRKHGEAHSLASSFVSVELHHDSRSIIENGIEIEETRIESIIRHPKIYLSPHVFKLLFEEKKEEVATTYDPIWIKTALHLSNELLKDISTCLRDLEEEYLLAIKKKDEALQKNCENKIDFFKNIQYLDAGGELTAQTYYEAQKEQNLEQYVSSAWEVFLKIIKELKNTLMKAVSNHSSDQTGYPLTDTLLAQLEKQQRKYPPVPNGVDFERFEKSEVVRWQFEKRYGIDHLMSKRNFFHPRDFAYIDSKLPCFEYKRYAWTKSTASVVKTLLEKNVKDLVWMDAGGYGPDLQLQLRTNHKLRPA